LRIAELMGTTVSCMAVMRIGKCSEMVVARGSHYSTETDFRFGYHCRFRPATGDR
jgi:hypothetical protein